jgi:RNA polymerase sigma factor (sigma-70 family)
VRTRVFFKTSSERRHKPSVESTGGYSALTPTMTLHTVPHVRRPVAVAARSPLAPPYRPDRTASEPNDKALLDAVRAGDLHAYGALYERHVDAVRRLARRLCSNHSDVDDVIAEVFTNSLRAIRSGRGPSDDLRSYVLTSTRNTVAKLQTRSDSGRATPTSNDDLEDADDTDPYHVADPIGHAFVQLPDRFQNVLWLTCVEGMAPHEVGERTRLNDGAVTSLCLRARRALAREYLLARVQQPLVDHACRPVRELMPAMLHGDAAESTVMRVESHVAVCDECRACYAQMRVLAGEMRSVAWPVVALAWVRGVLLRATAPLADSAHAVMVGTSVIGTVAAMAVTTGDAPANQVTRSSVNAEATVTATIDGAPGGVQSQPPPAPGVGDGEAQTATGRPPVPTRAADAPAGTQTVDEPSPAATPDRMVAPPRPDLLEPVDGLVQPVVEPIVDPFADPVLDPLAAPVDQLTGDVLQPLTDPVSGAAIDPIIDSVLLPAQQSLAPVTDAVLGAAAPVIDPALDHLMSPVAAAVLDPIDTIIGPVTTIVVEPLEPTAVGEGATTDLVDDLLGLLR